MDPIKTTLNTYSQIAQPYSDEYYDYFKNNLEHLKPFINGLPEGGKVLDAGSGPGGVAEYFATQGFEVVGVDNVPEMISLARKKVPSVEFREMDIRQLDFPKNSFDGIISEYSIIHIPRADIQNTLQGFHRVLKQGGLLYVSLFEGDEERYIDEPFKPSEKAFWNFIPAKVFEEILIQAGFNVIHKKKQKTQAEEDFLSMELFFVAEKR